MPYNHGMRVRPFSIVLAVCLTGCGYKGPLYLAPVKPAAPQPPAVVTPSAVLTTDPERPMPPEAVPPPK